MKNKKHGKLLRIYVGTDDHYNGMPLYEAIVRKLRELGMSGVSVFKGIEGFGARSTTIHRDSILRLSNDLPILIEAVDIDEKIRMAITAIEEIIESEDHGSLVTLEDVEIIRYK